MSHLNKLVHESLRLRPPVLSTMNGTVVDLLWQLKLGLDRAEHLRQKIDATAAQQQQARRNRPKDKPSPP